MWDYLCSFIWTNYEEQEKALFETFKASVDDDVLVDANLATVRRIQSDFPDHVVVLRDQYMLCSQVPYFNYSMEKWSGLVCGNKECGKALGGEYKAYILAHAEALEVRRVFDHLVCKECAKLNSACPCVMTGVDKDGVAIGVEKACDARLGYYDNDCVFEGEFTWYLAGGTKYCKHGHMPDEHPNTAGAVHSCGVGYTKRCVVCHIVNGGK